MEKTKSLALILGVLATSVFVSYLVLAWTEPSSAPPAGNVSAPINVGTGNQIKAGGLGISGGFFVDSPTLVIDAVNDRVGIGTTTPSNMLTVSGSANFTGNVGIGITSPTQKLEVAGSILTTGTGDVCNGAGKCLSSVFQTNVIVGANPICPTGQTAIAKMDGGIWYSSTRASWNQIMCGQVMSSDGTTLLVNNNHTSKNCVDAGGTVVSDGVYDMCRFNAVNCPVTWTPYSNWSTVPSLFLETVAWCDGVKGNCTTPGRAWANSIANTCCSVYWGCGPMTLCNSAYSQIGCY